MQLPSLQPANGLKLQALLSVQPGNTHDVLHSAEESKLQAKGLLQLSNKSDTEIAFEFPAQPFASYEIAVYKPGSETVIVLVVAPLLQMKLLPFAEAVRSTDCPTHNCIFPPAVIDATGAVQSTSTKLWY